MIARAAISFLLLTASVVQAAEEEKRTFTVRVDNKPAGSHQLIIQTHDDGTEVVVGQADVTVKFAIITFTFSYRGKETWKDGRLVTLNSATNDNGKKHQVNADANKEGYAVVADGKESQAKGDVWPTGYWRIPKTMKQAANVVLLDSDTGRLINAKLEKIGVEKLTVIGQEVKCAHYRLSGGVKVDVWFDGHDRLVRQESIEEGHRTVLELTGLKRE